MGLLHSFVNWGISVVDNTETDLRRIGQRLGYLPLSWRQTVMNNPAKEGLLWRIPDPQVPMASSLVRVQALLVAENEQVLMLRNGVLSRGPERGVLLPPGLFDIARVDRRDQIEVIWISMREIRLRWGVSDVLTQDGIGVGASGHCNARIIDPEDFFFAVAPNDQIYKEEQLVTFTKPVISSNVRDLIARKTVTEFQVAQQEFIEACREKLRPAFRRWGLEFLELTIDNQNIPPEFRQALSGRTIVTLEKAAQIEGAKADIQLAQLEAQKALYLAQIEAAKLRALGQVNIEMMQSQMGLGIDPMELKRIEALNTLAANPGEGALIDNRPQIAGQLLGRQPIQHPVEPVIIPGTIMPFAQQSLPPGNQGYSSNSGPLTPPTANTTGPLTREKIQEQLDRLDERLINGEISDQKHTELYNRLQKKLDELS